jgi:hypothetical protein
MFVLAEPGSICESAECDSETMRALPKFRLTGTALCYDPQTEETTSHCKFDVFCRTCTVPQCDVCPCNSSPRYKRLLSLV